MRHRHSSTWQCPQGQAVDARRMPAMQAGRRARKQRGQRRQAGPSANGIVSSMRRWSIIVNVFEPSQGAAWRAAGHAGGGGCDDVAVAGAGASSPRHSRPAALWRHQGLQGTQTVPVRAHAAARRSVPGCGGWFERSRAEPRGPHRLAATPPNSERRLGSARIECRRSRQLPGTRLRAQPARPAERVTVPRSLRPLQGRSLSRVFAVIWERDRLMP